jgi:hypothetical protein
VFGTAGGAGPAAGYAKPAGAPLFLGMPSHCVALLRTCSLRQLTELADQHGGWLRPRWTGRTRVWRELLEAGICGEGPALAAADHGTRKCEGIAGGKPLIKARHAFGAAALAVPIGNVNAGASSLSHSVLHKRRGWAAE